MQRICISVLIFIIIKEISISISIDDFPKIVIICLRFIFREIGCVHERIFYITQLDSPFNVIFHYNVHIFK